MFVKQTILDKKLDVNGETKEALKMTSSFPIWI